MNIINFIEDYFWKRKNRKILFENQFIELYKREHELIKKNIELQFSKIRHKCFVCGNKNFEVEAPKKYWCRDECSNLSHIDFYYFPNAEIESTRKCTCKKCGFTYSDSVKINAPIIQILRFLPNLLEKVKENNIGVSYSYEVNDINKLINGLSFEVVECVLKNIDYSCKLVLYKKYKKNYNETYLRETFGLKKLKEMI